jgi:glycyl-tRNA synthetase beta chain
VPELLLEVGCEEIPASWLPGLCDQIRDRFVAACEAEHLQPKNVRAMQSSRRLVVAADLVGRQGDREEKVWGPALKVAKDAAGNWTQAAQGFARKNGVAVDALGLASKDGSETGERNLLYIRKVEGRSAEQVLPEIVGTTLRGLAFPKRMNWDAWLEDGKGAFSFGRPIRWIVALLDGKVVPFTIYGMKAGAKADAVVKSGNVTYGHRFLPRGKGGQAITVSSFADLLKKLEENFVLLDPAAREARIEAALKPHATEIHDDHGLPAEWRDLVEFPTILFGAIPAEFRKLPVAVLQTVLVHHQKYIPLMSEGVVARFAAVVNGDGGNGEEIVRGMGRVVTARLRDASFFFEEDRKRPLADRVEALAGVTFHRELGSYKQKTDRMVALIDRMYENRGMLRKAEWEAAREAARLCKADLTTLMVREFTELQGVMGGIYLRAEGVSELAAATVQWHYHPVSIEEGSAPDIAAVGDPTVFGAVSLADKLDTLAGYFGIGLIPSGSSDPFGLRRAAQGVVRVLLDYWTADDIERRPSLRRLIRSAVEGYPEFKVAGKGGKPAEPRDKAEIAKELEGFLLERLRYVLVSRGFPADEVDAVLGARDPEPIEDPHEAWVRLKALHRVRQEARADFEALAVAFKRAKNILEKDAVGAVKPELFKEPAERDLHGAVAKLKEGNGSYEARLRSLAGLRQPVDRFFDDVLVMAKEDDIRTNRLGLLSQALSLFYRIADISKLGG